MAETASLDGLKYFSLAFAFEFSFILFFLTYSGFDVIRAVPQTATERPSEDPNRPKAATSSKKPEPIADPHRYSFCFN